MIGITVKRSPPLARSLSFSEVPTSYFSLSSPLLDGHFVNLYHASAIDTVCIEFIGLILPFLAQEEEDEL